MKVMSRESENGEEGEISVVKEASHDVRNYVMKLWNGSSGRGIWRWPTFLSFAIDLDFDEQFPLLRKERGYLSSIEVEIHDENNDGQERTVLAFIA